MYLHIAVEACWRGSMLDTVSPVATLPLRPSNDLPGSRTIGEPFALRLLDGESVEVTCATNPANRYFLTLNSSKTCLLRVSADAPIYLEIQLADGKLYFFSIRAEA